MAYFFMASCTPLNPLKYWGRAVVTTRFGNMYWRYEGYSKSKLRELLTKQREKKIIYKKYILKLLLNTVTAGIEAFVTLGNKFLYACVIEVCHLWAHSYFDTFHWLITVGTLWAQPVLQVGKQVVDARSKIRAVRWVVKQLLVEILQQCLSASIPRLLFWMPLCTFFSVSQYTSDVTVVPCCMNSTTSIPFLSQKTATIGFLANNVCLNSFGLFGECVCIHCSDCSLVSTTATRTMWLRNSLPSLWYHSKKVKAEAILSFCVHPWTFLEPILCKTCDSVV
jgi:hypothetical protein